MGPFLRQGNLNLREGNWLTLGNIATLNGQSDTQFWSTKSGLVCQTFVHSEAQWGIP